jgi:aspartate/methionine/tyrosine aminotransferase
MVVDPGHPKAHIPLSLGDPTVFGNFALPPTLLDILKSKLDAQKNNGYMHSTGSVEARRAVASYYNSAGLAMPKLEEKVRSENLCSWALYLFCCRCTLRPIERLG